MIEFKNVSKVYSNGTKALNNVSIKIEKGEFVFVVGASGAGKSTFLKLMMREEVPTSGSIKIKDYDLVNMKKSQIPYFRRNMGIVFQDFRLIPTMDVYNNVAFAMRVVSARKKEIRKRVPYVISIVGLASKARCMPNELSGGEQQRVALARALANNAEIIIADEPTGNVDPQMSMEIVELLTRLNEAGTTVVMVTHAHDLVKKFNKRVIVLESGQVASDGIVENGAMPEASTGHLPMADLSAKNAGFRRRHGLKSKTQAAFESAAADDEEFLPDGVSVSAEDDYEDSVYDEPEYEGIPVEEAEDYAEDEVVLPSSSIDDEYISSILGNNDPYKIYLDLSEKGGDSQ